MIPCVTDAGFDLLPVNGATGDGPADSHSVLVVVAADGSGEIEVSDGGHFDWSPDGTQLVVSNADVPTVDDSIFIINADGTDRHIVGHGEFATWAPAPAR